MKPIHKVAGKKSLTTCYNYIQVKGGFVNATNGAIMIKSPISEVFPEGVIEKDEEIYFDALLWASSKMDKAIFVEREGLIFTAKDKNKSVIGVIKAINAEAMSKIAKYVDVDVILPFERNPVPLPKIAIDPFLLYELCSAFKAEANHFIYTFYGVERSVLVTHTTSKSIDMIFPLQGIVDAEVEEKESVLVEDDDDFMN